MPYGHLINHSRLIAGSGASASVKTVLVREASKREEAYETIS